MFQPKDREQCHRLLERYYAGRKFHDARYRDVIRKYLRPGHRVLDAGCGRYMHFCKEFSGIAHITGIDLDSTLETDNGAQPFGIRGDLGRLPFASDHFDMVISRSVIEHLDNPPEVFGEFNRVLRPGGTLVFITPNKYDYVSIFAALTPYWLHRAVVSRIFPVSADDVFPTRYRANTISSIRKTLKSAHFAELELEAINHYPAYLMFSPMLFRLGVLYERITSLEALKSLRGSLLCVFRKNEGKPGQVPSEDFVLQAESIGSV